MAFFRSPNHYHSKYIVNQSVKTTKMEIVSFPGVNVVFAEDQPEYLPLPALLFPVSGRAIYCFRPSPEEMEEINRTGRIFFSQETGGEPLQPIMCSATIASLFHQGLEPIDPEKLGVGDIVVFTIKEVDGIRNGGGHVVQADGDGQFIVRIEGRDCLFVYPLSLKSPSWTGVEHSYKLIAKVCEP